MTAEGIQINEKLSIPLRELRFQFSRSSGPGGQHVNRASTRVQLTFDVVRSQALDEQQRDRIIRMLGSYIDKRGVLHLVSEQTRSQWMNREDVVARFQELLRRALKPVKKRKKTRPSQSSKERRLAEKKRRSEAKQGRRAVDGRE